VGVTLTPTSDSDIKSEIWLPLPSAWNGKFLMTGNGAWAGMVLYPTNTVASGYVGANTDTGHDASEPNFGIGHTEKLIDFGWRAVHETAVAAKALAQAYYGKAVGASYFTGCSTGGRQAIAAAQKYPRDFNAIAAGDAVNPMTRLHLFAMMNYTMANKDSAIRALPAAKLAVIKRAVLDACDMLDGVRDGLIEFPPKCAWDPGTIQCKGDDAPYCLTAPQVELARHLYKGAFTTTGEPFYPGFPRGAESNWGATAGPNPDSGAVITFRNVVFKNPNWDPKAFDINFDTALPLSDREGNATINAVDYDLTPFFSGGGKLLMYSGWSDGNVSAQGVINNYDNMMKASGGQAKVSNDMRLFLVPGMGHCNGGEGAPATWNKEQVLDAWFTTSKAPDKIIGTHSTNGQVDRTRPLCPYPLAAKYKGSGNTDDAANFTCAKP
jgi:feruloyl esterase